MMILRFKSIRIAHQSTEVNFVKHIHGSCSSSPALAGLVESRGVKLKVHLLLVMSHVTYN